MDETVTDSQSGVRRVVRPSLRGAAVLAVALLGGWLGLLALGTVQAEVGPLRTSMSVAPQLTGGTSVAVPPLGGLSVDSHDGPLGLRIAVDGVDVAEARRLSENPSELVGLADRATSDVQAGIVGAAVRGALVAVVGAVVLVGLVFRQVWPTVAAVGIGVAVVGTSYGVAALTWKPEAINEPTYEGLLTTAPVVVGDATAVAANFEQYREQLAAVVTNLSRYYQAAGSVPVFDPGDDTIRVLHISDLHLGQSWDVIDAVAEQYEVDAVVDTGDTTSFGSPTENLYLEGAERVDVPYLWVRGNHDSTITQAAMADLDNVIVLDGEVVEVAGLRFVGTGDPRFTPDRSGSPGEGSVIVQAYALRQVAERYERQQGEDIDVIAYHDPVAAPVFDEVAPLVLSGHRHERDQFLLPGGTRVMVQGSTGGTGFDALANGADNPVPITMTVLYFDRQSTELVAWDDITVGGLGESSAQIERTVAGADDTPVLEAEPPAPSEPVPSTPVPTPTVTGDFPNSPTEGPLVSPPPTAPPT